MPWTQPAQADGTRGGLEDGTLPFSGGRRGETTQKGGGAGRGRG